MSKRRQKALALMKLKKEDGGSKNCITKVGEGRQLGPGCSSGRALA